MKKDSRRFFDIFIRYTILILVALPNLFIFYFIFTPLTIYSIYFLFNLFFDTSLLGNIFILNEKIAIELIKACIAGSAYYFLLILNLSIPKIKIAKRIKMIIFAFSSLLLINILRIFFLSLVAYSGYSFFDIAHELFWYFMSIIFVVGIWFAEVKVFKIKEIPFYSDLRFLHKKSFFKKIN
jgi:exosortase/archaeosortase family protein|tara:strand:- start:354 stop:896 length:543 start_codon:yes stop_codon:yes gene_type:complete